MQVEPGHVILVHAAAGGVGSLLCQWGSALGATVIGVVSTEVKAAQAKEDGAHHVLIQSEGDFVEKVKQITNGEGVHVVYDSVGKDTFLVCTIHSGNSLRRHWFGSPAVEQIFFSFHGIRSFHV